MAESIESFITKLQQEGVETGKKEAEKIRSQANRHAETTIAQAKQQAEQIVAEAQNKAAGIMDKSRTDLNLAARDAVLQLRHTLADILKAVLNLTVKENLANQDFLSKLLHDLVIQYAQADIEHRGSMEINVAPELRAKLCQWALNEMTRKAGEVGMAIDLKGSLAKAGFEYNVTGATVEVTIESVTEALAKLVNPALSEIIRKAASEARGEK